MLNAVAGGGRGRTGRCQPSNGVIKQLHFKPKAKRVIFLFMNGGVSHVDTFDPKPMLEKYDGKPMPGGEILTQRKTGNLMKSPFKFQKYGKSGTRAERAVAERRQCGGRHLRRSVRCGSESRTTSRRITMMNTGANFSAVRRWARGSPTGSAPRTRICPATSCSRRPSR